MAAVEEVDIGFDLNITDSNPKELDLDLCVTSHIDDGIQPAYSDLGSNGVPKLLMYLDNQNDSEKKPEETQETAEKYCPDNGFTENIHKEEGCTNHETLDESLLANNIRMIDTKPSQTHQPLTADNINPSPVMVESPAGQVINMSEKTTEATSFYEEATTSCDEDHNPLASILSDVLSNVNKPEDVLEVNVSDSINLNSGFSSLDTVKDKGQEPVGSVEKTIQGFGDSAIEEQVNDTYNTKETLDYKAAADTNPVGDIGGKMIQSEVAVEPSKSDLVDNVDDEVHEAETVAIPALKNDAKLDDDDDDDDDFAFELPQKSVAHFDVSHIKSKISAFDCQLNRLHGLNTTAPVTEPYEELQQEIQKVLTDADNWWMELNTIKQLAKSVPPEHEEYRSVTSWCENSECKIHEIQQQAQIRLSQVLEAINEKQAKLFSPTTESHPTPGGITELAAAEAEWAKVQTVTPEIDGEFAEGKRPAKVSTIPSVGYSDILNTAKSTFNLSQYEPVIKTSVQRRGFSGLIHKLFGTRLHKSLQDEQKLVFCLAACPYQDAIPCHWHVLHTIYRRLTGAKVDTPRYGGHWESIGFQGNDPATDLRGSGFLGLLQLLYMLSDPALLPLAKEMYKLSLHETQNFPFCIMGINMTRIVLQVLREDHLNKECNKRKQVLDVVNEFYMALWFQLFTIWKTQHKTIRDTGFVFNEIESSAKKRPHALITSLNNHLAQHQSQARIQEDKQDIKFQAVCDFEDDQM